MYLQSGFQSWATRVTSCGAALPSFIASNARCVNNCAYKLIEFLVIQVSTSQVSKLAFRPGLDQMLQHIFVIPGRSAFALVAFVSLTCFPYAMAQDTSLAIVKQAFESANVIGSFLFIGIFSDRLTMTLPSPTQRLQEMQASHSTPRHCSVYHSINRVGLPL